MKNLFLVLFLIPIHLFCQDTLLYNVFPLTDGKVTYEKIFSFDSSSKELLFTKIKEWAVDHYKSQKSTLETEDKQAGFLAYKGYISVPNNYTAGILKGKQYLVDVYHTIKFYIKDNKIKIIITDLETLSHDFASGYISDRNMTSIPRVKVEDWSSNLDSRRKYISKKKVEKWENNLTEAAKNVENGITGMFMSIHEALRRKSAFDF